MKSSRLLGLLVGVSLVALSGAAAEAKEPAKEAKSYKITGKVQFGYSTDRHAGVAPVGESMAGDDFDSDDEDDAEDDDDSGDEMAFDDTDVFEDLDLEDQDLLDQLDETTDEDGDGNFFDDDEGFVPGDDPTADDEVVDAVDPVDPADPIDPTAISTGPVTTSAAAAARRKSPNLIRDNRFTAKAALGYTQKIGTWAKEWKTGAQIATSSFDTLTKSDTTLFGLSTGPVFKIKSWNAQIMPSLIYANLRKDGDFIFNNVGGALAGAFDLSKQWKLGLRYGYDVREFEDNAIDSVGAYSTGAALKYVIQKNQAITLGFKTRLEATSPAARAKDATQVSLAFQQKWTNGWYVKPTVGYAWVERDAPAKRTQPLRKDERATFNLAVGKDFGHGINVEAQYGNMETDVNLPNKDSANDRFVLLTGWKF